MRALFFEALLDITKAAGLGIGPDCLSLIMDDVDHVISAHRIALADRKKFTKVYADFEEFIQRMVQSAQLHGWDSLRETTRHEAKQKCGLEFWCG